MRWLTCCVNSLSFNYSEQFLINISHKGLKLKNPFTKEKPAINYAKRRRLMFVSWNLIWHLLQRFASDLLNLIDSFSSTLDLDRKLKAKVIIFVLSVQPDLEQVSFFEKK